jgi:hypothetical protein
MRLNEAETGSIQVFWSESPPGSGLLPVILNFNEIIYSAEAVLICLPRIWFTNVGEPSSRCSIL